MQLNSIILEGNIVEVFDEGYNFKLVHDSSKGRPVSIMCHAKQAYKFNYDNFNRSIFRVVGKLRANDNYGIILEADYVEEHP